MRGLLYSLIVAVCLVSCQKEIDNYAAGSSGGNGNGNGNGDGSLTGTWQFAGVSAETVTSNEFSYLGTTQKVLGVFSYTSGNNTGTVSFTENSMTTKDVGYTITGDVTTYLYEDYVLMDSVSIPTAYDFVVLNSTVPYVRVTADSLYFPEGGFTLDTADPDPSSEATGVRIEFSGNTLKLKQNTLKDSVYVEDGIAYRLRISAIGEMTLKKP